MNQRLIYKLLSLILSAFFIALFIFLLPSILLLVGALVLFLVASSLVVAFLIKKKIIKTNVTYVRSTRRSRDQAFDEEKEMIDVTDSNKN
ncbi:MAG: hypothetical protein ISQ34_04715 [Rickettsiales bacterium]|nr:hypothetical protein [Rickettsiales bacterium]